MNINYHLFLAVQCNDDHNGICFFTKIDQGNILTWITCLLQLPEVVLKKKHSLESTWNSYSNSKVGIEHM